VTDQTELGKAEKTVAALRKKLAATDKAQAKFQRPAKESEKDLVAFAIGLDKAVTAPHKARAAHASEKAHRAELVGTEG
jgi:nitrogen fixation protein FixH